MRFPHTTPPRWPEIRPGRFSAAIRTDSPDGCAIALLGLPDDTGVKLNGGRPGAREGPAAFRAALAGYGTPYDGEKRRNMDVRVFDAGDIEPASGETEAAMFETHARVVEAVGAIHSAGMVPVCIGGGHDLTLPTVTALSKHVGQPVGGVNFDAHLDVRQLAGSGMPYRRLIDGGWVDPHTFAEVGVGRFVNDEADLQWLRDTRATLRFADEMTSDPASAASILNGVPGTRETAFVSIDVDGIDSSQAPGVSAINPCGLTVAHAARLASAAGADQRVRHFDIMELSPPNDVAGRTARVAAHLFLSFIAGFAERNP